MLQIFCYVKVNIKFKIEESNNFFFSHIGQSVSSHKWENSVSHLTVIKTDYKNHTKVTKYYQTLTYEQSLVIPCWRNMTICTASTICIIQNNPTHCTEKTPDLLVSNGQWWLKSWSRSSGRSKEVILTKGLVGIWPDFFFQRTSPLCKRLICCVWIM